MNNFNPLLISHFENCDAPAKALLEKNNDARLLRKVQETKDELSEITNRIETTLHNYEFLKNSRDGIQSSVNLSRPNSADFRCPAFDATMEFIDDITQLESILLDPVSKRKYQQYVTIFVVGYENACGNRLELLSQINNFFCTYSKDTVPEIEYPDFSIENVGISTRKTLKKASMMQNKLKNIGKEVATTLHKLNNERSKSHRKKTERELLQLREHMITITEKLMTAKEELENANESVSQAYRDLEIKQVEIERLKTQLEVTKKELHATDALNLEICLKTQELEALRKKNEVLETKAADFVERLSKYEEKEQKQMQENQDSVRKLQDSLIKVRKDTEHFYEKQLSDLRYTSRTDMESEKTKHLKLVLTLESTIQQLKENCSKAEEEKAAAINDILTKEVSKEINDKRKAQQESVDRIVKYEKELFTTNEKVKQLEEQLKNEKESNNEKKETKADVFLRKIDVVDVFTQTDGECNGENEESFYIPNKTEHLPSVACQVDTGTMTSPILFVEPNINAQKLTQRTQTQVDTATMTSPVFYRDKTIIYSPVRDERPAKEDDSYSNIRVPEYSVPFGDTLMRNVVEIYNEVSNLKELVFSWLTSKVSSSQGIEEWKSQDERENNDDTNIEDRLNKILSNSIKSVMFLTDLISTVHASPQEPRIADAMITASFNAAKILERNNDSLEVSNDSSEEIEIATEAINEDFPHTIEVPKDSPLQRFSEDKTNSHLYRDHCDVISKHADLVNNLQKEKTSINSSVQTQNVLLKKSNEIIQELENTVEYLRHQLQIALYQGLENKKEEFIFTRTDIQHNQRALRESVHNQNLTEELYEDIDDTMDMYASISANRLAGMVRRYQHFKRMQKVETDLKSKRLARANVKVLKQMEILQNKRTTKWILSSAVMTIERVQLAKTLMRKLESLENSTGMFIIKPFRTSRRKDEFSFNRTENNKPLLNQPTLGHQKQLSQANLRLKNMPLDENTPRWNPSLSNVKDGINYVNRFPTIPRLLELEVNRSMFSENLISMPISPTQMTKLDDQQLNLISYVTVDRPVAPLETLGSTSEYLQNDSRSTHGIGRPNSLILPTLNRKVSLVTEEVRLDCYSGSSSSSRSRNNRRLNPVIQ